jgi:hypothetical protein
MPDSRGALVLLALWPVGLLFPAPVAFGLGQVFERLEEGAARLLADTPFLRLVAAARAGLQPLLPGEEVLCVALGALVPCLLGYTVIARGAAGAVFALLALAAGVAVSALSAALTYGPVHAWAWIGAPVQLGLWLAALAAALLLALCRGSRLCGGAADGGAGGAGGAAQRRRRRAPTSRQTCRPGSRGASSISTAWRSGWAGCGRMRPGVYLIGRVFRAVAPGGAGEKLSPRIVAHERHASPSYNPPHERRRYYYRTTSSSA